MSIRLPVRCLLVSKFAPYYADRLRFIRWIEGVLFPKGEFSLHCGSPWLEWLSFPCFIPQRRGSLKTLTEGSLLFECSLSFILLISKFYPPTTQTSRCLIPQRRGSLKNLTEGSLLFECSLSFNLLISNFVPPTTQTFRCLIVGGVVWVW